MTEKLKPVRCGCGEEAVLRTYGEPETPYCIQCTTCGITTLGYATETEAITAWNKAMGATDTNVGDKSVENIYSVGDYGKIYVYGSCPECGSAVIKPDKYCSECGARLEWE